MTKCKGLTDKVDQASNNDKISAKDMYDPLVTADSPDYGTETSHRQVEFGD